MVTITNGKIEVTVTEGAYKSIYKRLGWVKSEGDQNDSDLIADTEVNGNIDEGYETTEDDSDRSEIDTRNLSEKPLGEMSTDELFEYGLQIGADVNEDMTRKEIRNAVKAKLAE